MSHVLTDPAVAAELPRPAGVMGAALPPAPAPLSLVDPRARILGAAAFAVVAVGLSDLLALSLCLLSAFCLLAASGRDMARTLRQAAMMEGFLVFLLLTLPFSTPGAPVFALFGFPASAEGLHRTAEIALTANAAMIALLTLAGTLEPVTLGHALHALKAPERLVHLLLFTIRYIDVLREEHLRLRAAMKVRGFRPGTNRHTYRAYGYLVGMMLVRAVERSERILMAMKCRGFHGALPLLEEFRYGPADRRFALFLLAALAVPVAVEVLRAAA